jgi:hypothetical protein
MRVPRFSANAASFLCRTVKRLYTEKRVNARKLMHANANANGREESVEEALDIADSICEGGG